MPATKFNWIGLFLLLLWMPDLTSIVPLPAQQITALRSLYESNESREAGAVSGGSIGAKTDEGDIDKQVRFMSTRIRLEWAIPLVFSVLGVASSISAMFRWRYWGGFSLAMVAGYCISVVLQYETSKSPFLEAWLDAAQASISLGDWGSVLIFFWGNLVQPVSFFLVLVYLLYYRPDVHDPKR